MKLRTENGKWYINDNGRIIEFTESVDAWRYILLMKEIRTNPTIPFHSLYPVRSLIPSALKGGKKVVYR